MGIPEKMIGTHIDISESKNKETELANQRNEYDHLVNNLAEIIFKTEEEFSKFEISTKIKILRTFDLFRLQYPLLGFLIY